MIYKNGFRIICLGTYCLPRVIATVCHFKLKKEQGEKTCPFDLAFCWNFDGILDVLDKEFMNFFTNLEYDYFYNENVRNDLSAYFTAKLEAKFWKNEHFGFIFNHETGFSFDDFKSRYEKRINNFYEYIKDNDTELYFLISSFNPISDEQIVKLNNIISHYRSIESFKNIIINQSENNLIINQENTHIINAGIYNQIFRGDWALMIKEHEKYKEVNKLYNLIDENLKKYILKT